jgi:stress response protein YsnF
MPASEKSIPVVEEDVHIEKRTVSRGRVRVETVTEIRDEVARADLETSDVEIVRVPVGREVEEPPAMRTEGETIIVPVLEEVFVVEKRLMLKEELHITRRVTSEAVEIPVRLRKQRAVVRRERGASEQTSEDKENG